MILETIPWLELAVLIPLLGSALVRCIQDPKLVSNWTLVSTILASVSAAIAWSLDVMNPEWAAPGLLTHIFGRPIFQLDTLNAPLVFGVSFLHFIVALITVRTKSFRFSFSRLLLGDSIRTATFACINPVELGILLAIGVIPPFLELRHRQRPTGVYTLHMLVFLGFLASGLATEGSLSAVLLLVAILTRTGTFPLHTWVVDLFARASLGTALLNSAPIVGMYAALRLVLSHETPEWIFQCIGFASLVTAIYAAGLAVIQTEARRFLAYFVLSHIGLVMLGMELHTTISLTGALSLWVSEAVSIVAFGLMIRALEARFERLDLTDFLGLYQTAPLLAISFLISGLACVGFPGTSGFLAMEMLADGALTVNPAVGIAVLFATTLNSIAILKVYFTLFTGANHRSNVDLNVTLRERIAILSMLALIILAGLMSEKIIRNRHQAAEWIVVRQVK